MSQRARRNCILKDHFCFQSFYKVPFIRPQQSPYALCASLWVISFHYELKIQAFSVSEVCFLTSPAFCSRETVWFYESSHWPLNVSSIMEILLPTKSTPRSPPLQPLHFGLLFCVFSFPSFPHSSFFSPSLCLLFPPPASSVQTFAGISLQLCSATDWKTGFKKNLTYLLYWFGQHTHSF